MIAVTATTMTKLLIVSGISVMKFWICNRSE